MSKAEAVIVTRGDVDLSPILTTFFLREQSSVNFVTVWDNSKQINLRVFGRFVAANGYPTLIYTQDDDCITSPEQIIALWEPGKIICNMSAPYRANYQGKPEKLLGFGSVFERDLIRPTFERYFKHFPIDDLLLRECDRIFTGLNQERIVLVNVPFSHLPWAESTERLYRQACHLDMVAEARRRIAVVLEREHTKQ